MDPRRSPQVRTPITLFGFLSFLAALVLVFSACASNGRPATETTPRTANVDELAGVSDLRERFNEDSGRIRLILLISPT